MADAASTATASVVFLALEDFARQPVAGQVRLRERLDDLIARAIEPLAPADRMVAETGDGAALVLLGTPADALRLARRACRSAHQAPDPLALRVGVNAGPVALATDPAGEIVLVGDAITAGASIAALARAGQMLASRAFRDALGTSDPDEAARLGPGGTLTYGSLGVHEVYDLDAGPEPAAGTVEPESKRRRVLLVATVAAAGIVGAGALARSVRHARRPATVELAIAPFGEIRIDGVSKGRTPPLKRLEVGPGKHTIEVRHPAFAPLTVEVELDPGEQMTLRHAFGAASSQQKSASGPRELWRDFRKKLGF